MDRGEFVLEAGFAGIIIPHQREASRLCLDNYQQARRVVPSTAPPVSWYRRIFEAILAACRQTSSQVSLIAPTKAVVAEETTGSEDSNADQEATKKEELWKQFNYYGPSFY